MWRTLAILGLALTTAACAHRAYDGPARPAAEVATLVPNPAASHVGVMIDSIDGRPLDAMYSNVQVAPGVHTLAIQVLPGQPEIMPSTELGSHRNWSMWERAVAMTMTFTAEAGRTYAFDGRYDFRTARAWLVDGATGRRVAEVEGELAK